MPCNPRNTAVQGQGVALQIQFYDSCGSKVMADEIPVVEIYDQDNNLLLTADPDDVKHLGDGLYEYIYTVPTDGDTGVWRDRWVATIGGAELDTDLLPEETALNFTVVTPSTGLSADNGPGKILIADDVKFDFSDEEIKGINILLKFLKARLRSVGKKPQRDEFGAFLYDGYGELLTEDCDVFTNDILVALLMQALSEFNSTPFFTNYSFADPLVQTLFSQVLVEAAYVFALSSQALIEKGRDFTISDGGINYQPPALGDFLSTHYQNWLTTSRERIKFIKNNIRPGPMSYGTHTNLTGAAPAWIRLRHLKARRIY
jgi:hypothetical protein